VGIVGFYFDDLEDSRQRDSKVSSFMMASPLVFRSPQCVSCLRRTAGSFGKERLFPAEQQIRGKKTARTANKVNALLREDIDGYGKKGTSVASISSWIILIGM
jgi:hypothetical protein